MQQKIYLHRITDKKHDTNNKTKTTTITKRQKKQTQKKRIINKIEQIETKKGVSP